MKEDAQLRRLWSLELTLGDTREKILVRDEFRVGVQMLLFVADEIEVKEDLRLVCDSLSSGSSKLSSNAVCTGFPTGGLEDAWLTVFPATTVSPVSSAGISTDVLIVSRESKV